MELLQIWYKDKEIGIFFDDTPQVGIRYQIPSMTKEEKKAVEKYPFINRKNLKVKLFDYKKGVDYVFSIPKGYAYDGATIPRVFWRLIGAKTDPAFLVPALIHDVLCENHSYVNNDRRFADSVFERLLRVSNVSAWKRKLMLESVDLFQRFCRW